MDRIAIAALSAGLLVVPGTAIAVESAAPDPLLNPVALEASTGLWDAANADLSHKQITARARAVERAEQRAARLALKREQATFTPESSKAYAERYMHRRYGWGDDQYRALVDMWTRESGWDHTADNPYSDAYGIPQALPGHKMAENGADWRTDPRVQIRWGLRYIKDTYGSPLAALGFWNSNGWY